MLPRLVCAAARDGAWRPVAHKQLPMRFFCASNKELDVLVIGGGVMGCAAAYHLAAMSNLRIGVLERDPSYRHTSAVLSAGGIHHQFSEVANIQMCQYGTQFFRHADSLLQVAGHEPPQVHFVEGSYLSLATESSEHILRRNFKTQREAGRGTIFLTPQQVKERYPWISVDGVTAATLGEREEGWFDPWAFLCALKRKCASLGVDVFQGEAKEFVLDSDNTIRRVRVGHQESCGERGIADLKVKYIVNAAGCWSTEILEACGFDDYPVRPRKRNLFVFHCPYEETWNGPTGTPLVVDPSGVYFRPEGTGGQFLAGVTPARDDDVNGFNDEELDYPEYELFENVIWPALANRVPLFQDIRFISAWAGYYEYNTLDQNAIIGRHTDLPNMYLLNGFSGHGLMQSPAAGRAIAELILYNEFRTIDLTCFSHERVRDSRPIVQEAMM